MTSTSLKTGDGGSRGLSGVISPIADYAPMDSAPFCYNRVECPLLVMRNPVNGDEASISTFFIAANSYFDFFFLLRVVLFWPFLIIVIGSIMSDFIPSDI